MAKLLKKAQTFWTVCESIHVWKIRPCFLVCSAKIRFCLASQWTHGLGGPNWVSHGFWLAPAMESPTVALFCVSYRLQNSVHKSFDGLYRPHQTLQYNVYSDSWLFIGGQGGHKRMRKETCILKCVGARRTFSPSCAVLIAVDSCA